MRVKRFLYFSLPVT